MRYVDPVISEFFAIRREVTLRHLPTGERLRIDYLLAPRSSCGLPPGYYGLEAKCGTDGIGDFTKAFSQCVDYAHSVIDDPTQCPTATGQRLKFVALVSDVFWDAARVENTTQERERLWPPFPGRNHWYESSRHRDKTLCAMFGGAIRLAARYGVGTLHRYCKRERQPHVLELRHATDPIWRSTPGMQGCGGMTGIGQARTFEREVGAC